MALKGLVHKVFGAPPGAVSKGTKPGVLEAVAVSDTAFSREDLGPLERAQPSVVEIDDEKLEEIAAVVKNEVQVEADAVVADDPEPEPVTDETSVAADVETAPVETDDNPVETAPAAAADAVAEAGDVTVDDADAAAPDDSLETVEADADADSAAESGDAPDEGEDGEGEDGEEKEEGGDLFSSLFAGVTEDEEDDYLGRLIATIPEVTAQDLLDQAEDLKALMQDLG